MADTLTKLFGEWESKTPDGTTYQAFQAGLTAGAVSMRTRSLKIIEHGKSKDLNFVNDIKNKIGQLSDIPTD